MEKPQRALESGDWKSFMEEKELPLLEIRNLTGETHIYRAATDGKLKLLKYLTKHVADLKKHFHRSKDNVSILHAAVVAQRFEVVLWLLKLDETQLDGTLAYEKDDNGCTCLQLLSTMPSVFSSDFLPEFRYQDDEDVVSSNVLFPTGDRKGRKQYKATHFSVKSVDTAHRNFYWDGINRILEIKKKNMLAEQLVDVLARRDNSWQKSFIHKQKTPNISPAILRSKVSTLVKQSQPKREKQHTEQSTHSNSEYTPLLLAAASGIVEIVEKLLEMYPQVINHVSEDELNILHVAVMYQQRKIY
ncbi:hypothetical protein L6164_002906 [Bauhinia variegata]|uniref:Uncharacterized protein n=1 Tax=Bauhinia variegata TaxID=167791 RepID=A0ACB9PZ32_BAUVA|nr:hypothetical protein L6164_002906 [Bauhinia variegata]